MFGRAWASLTLAVAAGVVVWLAGWPARADGPDLVAAAIADLMAPQTFVRGAFGEGVIQVDVERPAFTYDRPGQRLHWDGDTLWVHRSRDATPTAMPAALEQRVRDLWDEWQSGFEGTAFVVESPTFDPKVFEVPGRTYYRVMLPFSWAQHYLVYVEVTSLGRFGLTSVYDADTQEAIQLTSDDDDGGGLRWRNLPILPRPEFRDVPLEPSTYSPHRPARVPSGDGGSIRPEVGPHGERPEVPWHVRQQYVRMDRADQAHTVLAGATLAQRCETAPATFTSPVQVRFVFPSDPEKRNLAIAAGVQCPVREYETRLTLRQHPIAGQRTCVIGSWKVIDTLPNPDQILSSKSINACRTGPTDVSEAYTVDVPFPAGRDPTGLELRFDGDVRLNCFQPSGPAIDQVSSAALGILAEDYPVLAWWGCYPQ